MRHVNYNMYSNTYDMEYVASHVTILFIYVQRRSQRRETVRKHVADLLKSTSSIPFVLQLASHESEHQHRLDPTSAYLQKKGCLQRFTTHVVTPGAFGISCGLCG